MLTGLVNQYVAVPLWRYEKSSVSLSQSLDKTVWISFCYHLASYMLIEIVVCQKGLRMTSIKLDVHYQLFTVAA